MKFWNIAAAKTEGVGEVSFYGDICDEKWMDTDVTPSGLKEDLDALGDVGQLNIYINSGGGSVFAGYAIYNMLKRHPAAKTVYVDGLAASAASLIAMAGDKLVMPKNSMLMIHRPMAGVFGNSDDLMAMIDVLDRVENGFVAVYHEKSGLDEKVIRDMMAAEKWMTAAEAVELKFADEMDESKVLAASVCGKTFEINGLQADTSRFKNFPVIRMRATVEMEPVIDSESKAVTADEIKKYLEEIGA